MQVARIAEEPRTAEGMYDAVSRDKPIPVTGLRSGGGWRVRNAGAALAALRERLRIHLDNSQPIVRRRRPDQLAAGAVVAAEVLPDRCDTLAIRGSRNQSPGRASDRRVGVATQQFDLG